MKKIMLIGRLTKDPETKQSKEGESYVRFSLAINSGKNKPGEFFDCTAFKKTGEIISKYCKKANKVYVEGSPTIQDWTDKDGNKRKAFSVIISQVELLSEKPDEKSEAPAFDEDEKLPF